ncbi:M1 family aminopeptidase [Endozoicomonas numazuensis]|uniref:Uncharacterized protein n=1 Tax=Endozoicomonas numazuensis TaxID=1137799 RepID=A0A081NJW2_9GAMM|nr:M1 family aminopeptidase [Endozoicomonas numazuensis]KEQ18735.1 hypothetical protein GZ78_01145 [Endozoicomonas numazuensis]
MPLPQVATRTIVLLLMVFSLTGCLKLNLIREKPQSSKPVQTTNSLTQEEAHFRQSVLSDLNYELYLDISEPGNTRYSGRVSISFALQQTSKPLRLDFQQGEVSRFLINSQPADVQYNGHFITLVPGSLQQGKNTVEIEFLQKYSHHGVGLNRLQDTLDQQLYLFTQSLPFNSSRLFPVFDQPDLKARYKLTVKSPADWQVITSSSDKKTIKDGKKSWWYFSASEVSSPALFSLSAGPFRVWEDISGTIPLCLAVRQSLAKQVQPQTWFALTRQGLQFFGQYLNQPFPGLKFDQVLIPQLTDLSSMSGYRADERLISSTEVKENPEIQAQAIYESLARQWLADSASPVWWDSVWLQESLIRFLTFKAMDKGAHLGDTWPYFYRSQEAKASQADVQNQVPALITKTVTTHDALKHIQTPLYSSIQGKGPAILRQLEYRLTEETFRQGLRDYLSLNQDNGVRTEAFIQSMREASGKKLKHWTDVWFYTSGSNSVQAQWECKDQSLASITLHQSAQGPKSNVLREQQLNVGLYHQTNNQLALFRSLPVRLDGKKTKVPFSGRIPCPDAVFPNTDDYGYISVKMDGASLKVALKNRGDSTILETQLIDLLYNSVKQAEVDVHALLTRLYQQIPEESTPGLLFQSQKVLQELYTTLQTLRYQDESLEEKLAEPLYELESFVWQQLMIAVPGSIEQQSWFRSYRIVAHSQNGLARLEDLLDNRPLLSGLIITQNQRWDMLFKLI